jgi:hypothetical protein
MRCLLFLLFYLNRSNHLNHFGPRKQKKHEIVVVERESGTGRLHASASTFNLSVLLLFLILTVIVNNCEKSAIGDYYYLLLNYCFVILIILIYESSHCVYLSRLSLSRLDTVQRFTNYIILVLLFLSSKS